MLPQYCRLILKLWRKYDMSREILCRKTCMVCLDCSSCIIRKQSVKKQKLMYCNRYWIAHRQALSGSHIHLHSVAFDPRLLQWRLHGQLTVLEPSGSDEALSLIVHYRATHQPNRWFQAPAVCVRSEKAKCKRAEARHPRRSVRLL